MALEKIFCLVHIVVGYSYDFLERFSFVETDGVVSLGRVIDAGALRDAVFEVDTFVFLRLGDKVIELFREVFGEGVSVEVGRFFN